MREQLEKVAPLPLPVPVATRERPRAAVVRPTRRQLSTTKPSSMDGDAVALELDRLLRADPSIDELAFLSSTHPVAVFGPAWTPEVGPRNDSREPHALVCAEHKLGVAVDALAPLHRAVGAALPHCVDGVSPKDGVDFYRWAPEHGVTEKVSPRIAVVNHIIARPSRAVAHVPPLTSLLVFCFSG